MLGGKDGWSYTRIMQVDSVIYDRHMRTHRTAVHQSLPGKEWVKKHKHLAFVVPLESPRTKLSLYSFVDMTFCFVCPPTPVLGVSKDRVRFHAARSGLNVFVFKVKIRSRAQDWIWKLWYVNLSCHLGILNDSTRGVTLVAACPSRLRFGAQPWIPA